MSTSESILALGVSRLLNLHQKAKQRDRAKKLTAYLKMAKAINSNLFKCKLRFDSSSLFKLLGLIRPYMEALKVNLEEASVEERLLITLTYLATGHKFDQLDRWKVKAHLLESIIPETCKAIFKCLREYIKLPKTVEAWQEQASGFEKKWHFRNCLGALVAKHISIVEPEDEPHKYVNHKKYHSIVLVAVVNADYEFTYVDAGIDGAYDYVYESTDLFELLTNDMLNIPPDSPLKVNGEPISYVFLGETNFLIENIMVPYPAEELTDEKKVFNYRFARAKRVADNAFGVLYERFGVFENISLKDENLNKVVIACCALHNFLVRSSKEYLVEESLDVEDVDSFSFKEASWRLYRNDGTEWVETHPLDSLQRKPQTTCDGKGEKVRESFTRYFNDEGKVPFQYQMINVVPDYK